eukprot:7880280-Alexandrium_andersonii.AAC.1
MSASLVGSEMCIRDSARTASWSSPRKWVLQLVVLAFGTGWVLLGAVAGARGVLLQLGAVG